MAEELEIPLEIFESRDAVVFSFHAWLKMMTEFSPDAQYDSWSMFLDDLASAKKFEWEVYKQACNISDVLKGKGKKCSGD